MAADAPHGATGSNETVSIGSFNPTASLTPPRPPLRQPFYAPFGDAVRRHAPALFPVLQTARRALWRLAGSPLVWIAGLGALGVIGVAAFAPGLLASRLVLAGAALGGIVVLGLGALGWRLRRAIQTLSAENRRLAADIAHIHELAAGREGRVDRLVNDQRDVSGQLVQYAGAQTRSARALEDRLTALDNETGRTVHALRAQLSRTGEAARYGVEATLRAELSGLEARLAADNLANAGALRDDLASLQAELDQKLKDRAASTTASFGRAAQAAKRREAELQDQIDALQTMLLKAEGETASTRAAVSEAEAALREELKAVRQGLEQSLRAELDEAAAEAVARHDRELQAQIAELAKRLETASGAVADNLREELKGLQQAIKTAEEAAASARETAIAADGALRDELGAVRQGLEQRLRAEVDEATAESVGRLTERVQAVAMTTGESDANLRREIDTLRTQVDSDIKVPLEALTTTSKQALDIATGTQKAVSTFQKTGTMLQERVASAERQIGAIKYPDAPDVFVFFGHHKCGSRFFRNEVFGRIAESTGARVRKYHIANPPHHYSRLDDLDLPNIDFSGLGENGRDVVLFANATQRSLDKIRRTAEDWRGLRIIRDPRQVLVSNYFHHKGNHHVELNGWVWDQLKHDKPILNELPKEAGMLYELNNISKHVVEDLLLAPFDDERVLTLRLEDFSAEPKAHLEKIANFMKVPDIAGLNFNNTNANPESGPWRHHFTSNIREVFKERYGQALIDLGYEEDMDW